MNRLEKRSVVSIALLYASRMLGLFMVLPVFILYGGELEHASAWLIGLAIGAYGLSQSVFQIPFGALSDHFGRKKLIFAGLLLFFAGSVLAAISTSIYGVIAGRFLQGAGAIASVLMALLSDLTSEESRTKSMAVVGMSIGISFSIALVLGPLLAQLGGLQAIFWVTAGMAVVGMACLYWLVPSPMNSIQHRDTRLFKDQLKDVIRNPELLRLDLGIFILHMILTAMFIAVPMSLVERAGVSASEHWWVYLSIMLLSFFAMVPFIIVAETKGKMKQIFVLAIALLAASSAVAVVAQQALLWFWICLFVFFMAFNLLEASLPSLVSKLSPAGGKGTAMGVYSTSQFLGAFVGGLLGGLLLSNYGEQGVYWFSAAAGLVWLVVAFTMRPPLLQTGLSVHFSEAYDEAQASKIASVYTSVKGVEEVVAIPGERIAYLKVVKAELEEAQLEAAREALGF